MFDYIKILWNTLSNEDKKVASLGGISGWFCNLLLLNVSVPWEYIIKGLGGVMFTIIGATGSVLMKDIYTEKIKPKIFKAHGKKSNKKAA